MIKYIFISALILIASCQESTKKSTTESKLPLNESVELKFSGSWVQPNPINENEVQGFTLNEDSSASSINMATLLYKKWWLKNGKLFLISESIGNKVSSVDTTAYEVVNHTDSTLEIKNGNYTDKYVKQ